jgi:hypothetical protein
VLPVLLITSFCYGNSTQKKVTVNFFGDSINILINSSIEVQLKESLSGEAVESFYNTINASDYAPLVQNLLKYKESHQLDDWLYYQLIRRTAEEISPKTANYPRYTLYKWFLLVKSGYDAIISINDDKILFYIRSDDNIYDIPFFLKNNKQYVCLNRHDYKNLNIEKEKFYEVNIHPGGTLKPFSYRVTKLPDFNIHQYVEKDLKFEYRNKVYHFEVMLNPQIQTLFTNYPVVDFESYFNIPLSRETYSSLIPAIRKNIGKMNRIQGVDYLMNFTRYAFLYENDQENFGKEKRLAPEETLLQKYSDCDDRAALFFYLVREIYNLPMIVLLYPTHISIAVKFNKPIGEAIIYKGQKYSICDPTAQTKELAMGEIPESISKDGYSVVYEYDPKNNPINVEDRLKNMSYK